MGFYPRIPEQRLDPPEPAVVGSCKYCREDICAGDEIIELSGDHYHLECFQDHAAGILFLDFGARKLVAEEGLSYG